MNGKDLLSISDLEPDEVSRIVQMAGQMKRDGTPRLLEGKVVALLFEKPSLRTRVSFEVGVRQMGGSCIYLSQADIGLGAREPVADVARVLGLPGGSPPPFPRGACTRCPGPPGSPASPGGQGMLKKNTRGRCLEPLGSPMAPILSAMERSK